MKNGRIRVTGIGNTNGIAIPYRTIPKLRCTKVIICIFECWKWLWSVGVSIYSWNCFQFIELHFVLVFLYASSSTALSSLRFFFFALFIYFFFYYKVNEMRRNAKWYALLTQKDNNNNSHVPKVCHSKYVLGTNSTCKLYINKLKSSKFNTHGTEKIENSL